jgi:hypothetical protein
MVESGNVAGSVLIVQFGGGWRIVLEYDDGERFISRVVYASEAEVTAAAYDWALENYAPTHADA